MGDNPAMKYAGMILGPLLAAIMIMMQPPVGLSPEGWKVCALAVWMAVWWISEAVPLPVTSLLPIITLPTLGIFSLKQTLEPYSSSIIYLFFGGFVLSTAMQKWKLHLRVAFFALKLFGSGPRTILAVFMLVTCFMAMWVSNTATTIMMLPMAVSIAILLGNKDEAPQDNMLAKALVLGVAYSAVIGGLGTFVGTPTNAILQGHMERTYGYKLDLAEWMTFGVPVVLVLFGLAWALLCRIFLKGHVTEGAKAAIHKEYTALGKMSHGEKIVAGVFLLTVSLWIGGGVLEKLFAIKLDDAAIAVFGAFLLFLIPTNIKKGEFALSWKDTGTIPWGVLVFFGGSLSLSAALMANGVTLWLSHILEGLGQVEAVIIIAVVVALIIAVSEMMSNVATITAFLPILSALSAAINVNPLLLLVPATMSASCGFMLPGASAPNALAYGTGYVKVSDMTKTGLIMDIVALLVIVAAAYTIVMSVLGIHLGEVPAWAVMRKQ
jgi:solute carrier family 13 (sodium-dependent dicarboxylate transporter), member 2/3/5